jgi:hypothetical protein
MPYDYLSKEQRNAEPVREKSSSFATKARFIFRYRCGHTGDYEPKKDVPDAQIEETLKKRQQDVCDKCYEENKAFRINRNSPFYDKVKELKLPDLKGADPNRNRQATEIRAIHVAFLFSQIERSEKLIEQFRSLIHKDEDYLKTHPNANYTKDSLREHQLSLRREEFERQVIHELIRRASHLSDPNWWVTNDNAPPVIAHALLDREPLPQNLLDRLKNPEAPSAEDRIPVEDAKPTVEPVQASEERAETSQNGNGASSPEAEGAPATAMTDSSTNVPVEAGAVPSDQAKDNSASDSEPAPEAPAPDPSTAVSPAPKEETTVTNEPATPVAAAPSGELAPPASNALGSLRGQTGLTVSGQARIVFACTHETMHPFDAAPIDTAVRTIAALETLTCMNCQIKKALEAVQG